MASVQWSNLHPDILSIICKILNTDVDILRLRAVCTSWRSSVRPRLRPSSFPLKVPPLFSNSSITPTGGRYFLNYTTLYRLSPPEHGPHSGDPSDGWLFRVLEVNPNRFLILAPLVSNKPDFPPRTIPKYLNLLDYRITEICKCYSLNLLDRNGSDGCLYYIVRKVFILNALDCDFVALVLFVGGVMCYWKFGDKSWTTIDTKDYDVSDVIVFEGKCYAITDQGVLVSFDSKLNLTVVSLPNLPVNCLKSENYLVEYNSDLYVVSKIFECTNGDEDEGSEFPFQLKIFKKCKDNWKHIMCLGDVMFFSSDDVCMGLSAEDFRGKGNCVYVAHADYVVSSFLHIVRQGVQFGVYGLDGDRTVVMELPQDHTLYWPPPAWLMNIAQDNDISSSSD